MKTKRILSMMLSGLMVVSLTVSSMSLAVYADETETQLNESPSVSQENQREAPAGDYSIMPLIEDFEAPVLHSISIDKTEVATGEEITLTVEATDDLSGIEYIHAYFVNKENGREISFDFDLYDSETNDNDLYTTTVSVNEFEPSGVFELEYVRLSDRSGSSYNNGNRVYYCSRNLGYHYDDEELYLPNELSFKVNATTIDNRPPVLHSISIDKTEVVAGEEITLTVEATDDLSGIEYIYAYFVNKENGREISFDFDLYDSETNDNGLYTTTVSINEFEPNGVFELKRVRLSDRSGSSYNNGNTVYYYSRNLEYDYDHEELYLPNEISFSIKENISSDNNPPVLQTISVDKVTVETPGFVTLTVGATDDLSGIEYIDVYFVNKENGRQIAFDLWDFETNDNGKYTTTVSINEFEPSGVFELEYVRLSDRSGSSYNNGNTVYYYSRNLGYHYDDEELYLPNELSFFVHNSDEEAEGDLVSSTTNENLAENIEDLEEGKTAYIYYGSEAELNKDVFEAVAGTDKQLVLSSEGIQWIFDGKDVEAEKAKSLDLDVTIREDYRSDSENSDNITEALDNKNSIIVSFPENGELPGPATIRIKMDYQFREYINYVDGEASVFVYYYDNTTGEFVEVASNLVVGDDEYLEFTITHNSDFVIVNGTPATSDDNSQNGSNNGSNNDKSENKENESNNDKSEKKENESTSSSVTTNARTVPATGDKNSIGVAIALALFAVVCNVILINKKTSKYK